MVLISLWTFHSLLYKVWLVFRSLSVLELTYISFISADIESFEQNVFFNMSDESNNDGKT